MHKIIRFYNQNRKQIIRVITIITFIIILIQMLNYIYKNRTDSNNQNYISSGNNNSNISNIGTIVSNKSAITDTKVDNEKLNDDVTVINEFIENCNERNIEKAYSLLSNECKEEMYPTAKDFYENYYMMVFNNNKLEYSVENWIQDTYEVKFIEDMLATGKINDENKQDYITIVEENDSFKININNYIGREIQFADIERVKEILNKEIENNDIILNLIQKDIYMDYEVYKITIKNNTGKSILLAPEDKTNTIYLQNTNGGKFYAASSELLKEELLLENNYIHTIDVKFNKTYSYSNNIECLAFSNVVLDYEEYLNLDDKDKYEDIYNLQINL